MTKLIIAEKKDVAESIAKALGFRQGGGGFEGSLDGQPARLTWARGHLMSLAPPSEVVDGLSWDDPPSAYMPIPRVFRLRVTPSPDAPAGLQPQTYLDRIAKLARGCDEIILATDSDREGEAIGWNILSYLKWDKGVRRAWLASGTDVKSVREAFADLRTPDRTKGWYRASQARGRSDWAYQFLVRVYTYFARYSCFGRNLGRGSGAQSVFSVGRVQSTALYMIVAREREIQNFVSVTHYRISGKFDILGTAFDARYDPEITRAIIDACPPGVTWQAPKPKSGEGDGDEEGEESPDEMQKPLYTGRDEVEAFRERLNAAADRGKVVSYTTRNRREAPKKAYDLTDAQADVARACGISAGLAQAVIEDLYEQGWTSYARTAHSELPKNLYEPEERNGLLGAVSELPDIRESALRARAIHNGEDDRYKPFLPAVFTTKNMEHHGIIPTSQVMTPEAFSALRPRKASGKGGPAHTAEHMRTAYLLIAKRFVTALFPPATIEVQNLVISVPAKDMLGHDESRFVAKGERVVDPGWRSAFPGADKADTSFSSCEPGELATLADVLLKEAKTEPPPRYSETTFPKAMKNIGRELADPKYRALLRDSEGVGTPATRKAVIPTLVRREYIEVSKSGIMRPLPKGFDAIDVIPGWMCRPELTAQWEDKLVAICGVRDDDEAARLRDEFVAAQIDQLDALIADLNATHINNLGPRQLTTSKVTKKMADFIRVIAERKGIKIPKGTLSDPVKARAFLDEHVDREAMSRPSDKMKAVAERIISVLGSDIAVPDKALEDRQVCKAFIDEHIDRYKQVSRERGLPPPFVTEKMKDLIGRIAEALGDSPGDDVYASPEKASAYINDNKEAAFGRPSEKQLALAERLYGELSEQERQSEGDAFRTSRKTCSAFIDKHIGKRGPSEKQLAFAKRIYESLPESERRKLGDDIFRNGRACSAFIDAHKDAYFSKSGKSSSGASGKKRAGAGGRR